MEIVCEHDIKNVKRRMTDIRRSAKNEGMKNIYHNYYNNCDSDKEIFCVYGQHSVVIWADDNGITRGYFYSSDERELIEGLAFLPKGCVVDIITRTANEFADIMWQAGLSFHCEMHRFVFDNSWEAQKRMQERDALIADVLYKPDNARSACLDDLALVYDKLYEVFESSESHLPDKDELRSLIEKKWVALYFEGAELRALHIFKVEAGGRNYGYQTWNGTGVEGYYTVLRYAYGMYLDYLREHGIDTASTAIPAGYAWADIKNKKAIRGIKYSCGKFDGLIDYVYKKE